MNFRVVAGVLLLGSVAGWARAADSPSAAEVLRDVHRANQLAIEMGRLAQKKGQTQEMRRFGDILFYDHKNAERQVSRLAKAEKVDLGPVLPTDWPVPPGAAFDSAFAQTVLTDHQKDVAFMQQAVNSTADQRLQKLLSGVLLPMSQKHVDIARKILAGQSKK